MFSLMELLGGESKSDLERAVDRYYLGKGLSGAVSTFFDPDARRKKLEEQLIEKYLTSDSISEPDELFKRIASVSKPLKGLSQLLIR